MSLVVLKVYGSYGNQVVLWFNSFCFRNVGVVDLAVNPMHRVSEALNYRVRVEREPR